MYLEFYGLKEKPFSLTPDPAFLYYSEAHKRAVAFLKYGLQESKGFLQLTGPVGSGKTTLLRAILGDFDETTRTAYIINPSAPFPDLLRSIMKDLEIPNIPQTRIKIELLDFFHDYLLLQMRRRNSVIVIFDEAQNISLKNLEEIRMLSNFETTKGKLLQIVFVGQPELIETLDRADLRQLKQRIQVRYNLCPLSQTEVKAYINHRLKVAGSDGSIEFREDACKAIYNFSGGIPRIINSVCDVALLIGYVGERKSFDVDIIKEAIGELGGSFSSEPTDDPVREDDPEEVPISDTEGKPDSGAGAMGNSRDRVEVSRGNNPDTALSSDTISDDERPVISEAQSQSNIRTESVDRDSGTLSLHEQQSTPVAVIEAEESVHAEECLDSLAEPANVEQAEEEMEIEALVGSLDDDSSNEKESVEPPILVPERESDNEPGSGAVVPDKLEVHKISDLDEALLEGTEANACETSLSQEKAPLPIWTESAGREIGAPSGGDAHTTSATAGEYAADSVQKSAAPEKLDNEKENGPAAREQKAKAEEIFDLKDLMPTIFIPSPSKLPKHRMRPKRPHEGLLHSYLRHSKTGRFHVADSSVSGFAGAETTFGEKLKRIFGKDNGAIADTLGDGEHSLPEKNKAGVFGKEHGRKRRRPSKRGYLSLQKADTMKVAALMTDGKVILGRTDQISVREKGVYLSPPETRNNKTQQFIPFRHTLALRFLADYEDGWKRNCSPKSTNPTGRQVVVTLLNGEVIEGFTPKKFDTECLRFFVFMIDDERESSWTLVERAGTVGILTKDFKEGIYANEPLSLLELLETFILTDEKICSYESSGDAHFSAGDLDAALEEYALALENGADKERIEIKIALCYFNLGTNYLKQNKYQEAKVEFLKVNTGARLLEKARRKVIMIERMVGTNGIVLSPRENAARRPRPLRPGQER